ncbi:MAG: DJ-1/PfpI family protein [Burkholderiaceae bacterium]
MSVRFTVGAGLAVLLLSLAGFGVWLLSLPTPLSADPPPVAVAEREALVAALRPPKRQRPLVAVVGINDATETTDYLVTTGILRRADVADVVMLSSGPGPVRLYPAFTVEADATIEDFDARHPDGADYVIVPAMSRDDDPVVMAWLQAQARKGATLVGVCAGAKVLGAAGLLDGRRATTHWYFLKALLERHPSITWVPDRRMVVDVGAPDVTLTDAADAGVAHPDVGTRTRAGVAGTVVTTTGITASMPTMLVLVEAIAGRSVAEELAGEIGAARWDARHASDAFRLTRPFATTVLANVLGNALALRGRETVGIELRPGSDEAALALTADAWSRTYRSKVVAFAASDATIVTRGGVRIRPDEVASEPPARRHRLRVDGQRPVQALDQALLAIGARYGPDTADVVAMQLEYPRH